MLEQYIKGSRVIELIEESSEEGAYKALLRVTGENRDWSSLMVSLLMSPDEDSDFLVSIRKEYYISDANTPTFVWVLVLWGDLDEAFSELGPIISGFSPKVETPAKREAPRPTPVEKTRLDKKVYRTDDGIREVTRVPLPFKRGNRDNPNKTKTLGSRKGVGAYVSNVTSDGGL